MKIYTGACGKEYDDPRALDVVLQEIDQPRKFLGLVLESLEIILQILGSLRDILDLFFDFILVIVQSIKLLNFYIHLLLIVNSEDSMMLCLDLDNIGIPHACLYQVIQLGGHGG